MMMVVHQVDGCQEENELWDEVFTPAITALPTIKLQVGTNELWICLYVGSDEPRSSWLGRLLSMKGKLGKSVTWIQGDQALVYEISSREGKLRPEVIANRWGCIQSEQCVWS